MAERKLAVMRKVGFGVRDTNYAMLYFEADTMDNECSLQCLEAGEAIRLIERLHVANIKDLEGRHCWVECDGNIRRVIEYCEK